MITVAPVGGLRRAENTTSHRDQYVATNKIYMTEKVKLHFSFHKKQVLFSLDIFFKCTNKTDSYIKKEIQAVL